MTKRLDEELDTLENSFDYDELKRISEGKNLDICIEIIKHKLDEFKYITPIIVSCITLAFSSIGSLAIYFYFQIGNVIMSFTELSIMIIVVSALYFMYRRVSIMQQTINEIYYELLEIKRNRRYYVY